MGLHPQNRPSVTSSTDSEGGIPALGSTIQRSPHSFSIRPHRCTLLYLKRVTNKDLPYSTGNSAQCYVSNQNGKRILKRIDACVCITESLCCTPETIATFLVKDTKKKEMHKSKFISMHVTLTPRIQCSAVAPLY